MPQNKEKIVQSFISAFNQVSRKVEILRQVLISYKVKYQNLNPELLKTSLSSQNVIDMNTYLKDLNNLCDSSIVATIEDKDIPSYDTKGLD